MIDNEKDNQLEENVDDKQQLNIDENIDDLDDGDDKLSFKLENFEGPLDLLIHLIKKKFVQLVKKTLVTIYPPYYGTGSNPLLLEKG